jgi:hypothetical protein
LTFSYPGKFIGDKKHRIGSIAVEWSNPKQFEPASTGWLKARLAAKRGAAA